jgi:hypothetical protein
MSYFTNTVVIVPHGFYRSTFFLEMVWLREHTEKQQQNTGLYQENKENLIFR